MNIIRFSGRDYVPAAHECQSDPGVFKKVVLARQDFMRGEPQMLNWALLPAGKSFQLHYHEDMQEVFVIVDGAVRVEIDGDSAELYAGDAVVIDPGCVHAMRAIGAEDARYIVIGISRGEGGRTIVTTGRSPADGAG